ncbi:hypothetical protein Phum_PHUM113300 [Pediculus humanus corporis]|uniref:Cystatin domain-containing protein n=1 Tax=Pediculus humanus subsp. corporis TaxID=121224 RepID=E0VDE8_PEDHC|nr:uncharacterized protein Phum_PHUM113300 [Pediculus humanus corporis]EEB11404.1 hypothetical protein Phum_PHUM113300 [Pediculus humanus corporis]
MLEHGINGLPGGEKETDVNNPTVLSAIKSTMVKLNENLSSGENEKKFVETLKATVQVVSGTLTRVLLRINQGEETHYCYSKVWEQLWLNKTEVLAHHCGKTIEDVKVKSTEGESPVFKKDILLTVDPTSSTVSPDRWQYGNQSNFENKSDVFELWKWCHVFCKPCRWFDSIDYEYKICRFSYVAGHFLVFAGLPPMLGHLLVGIICGNLPTNWFPSFDPNELRVIIVNLESILPIISLATMNNIVDNTSKTQGLGEGKQISTILNAASGVNVIISVIFYIITLSYMHPDGFTTDLFKWKAKIATSEWIVVLNVLEQTFVGTVIGCISGLLISFFPDKHNALLPYGVEFNEVYIYDSAHTYVQDLKTVKQTVVLAILITTPIVNYVLLAMSHKFLSSMNYSRSREPRFEPPEGETQQVGKSIPTVPEEAS